MILSSKIVEFFFEEFPKCREIMQTRQSLTDMHDFGMHSIDGSAAESDARSHASSYAPVVSLSGAGIGDTPVATTPDACVSSLGSNSSGKESACENSGSITFRAAQNDVTHQGSYVTLCCTLSNTPWGKIVTAVFTSCYAIIIHGNG